MSSAQATFTLTSPKFINMEPIPVKYTCNGENVSPPLNWQDAPTQTKSYVLILSSNDAPLGLIYLWVVYNIPADVTQLTEGIDTLPEGAMMGNNTTQESNYRSPCPPDSTKHTYIFTLYALDTTLDLSSATDVDEVLKRMKKHIIGQAQLAGTFSH